MRHRSINWEEIKKYYESKQILAVNFEIIDMNKEDMEIKAFHAASLLKQLIQNYNVNNFYGMIDDPLLQRVYVHCTAGIGRAPQTVVSYLIFFENYHVEDAIRVVQEKRPVAWINRGILKQLSKVNINTKFRCDMGSL